VASPPLSVPQAFAIAQEKAGVKSVTTIHAWCEMWPKMVVGRYRRLKLIDPDKFDQFLQMRPRQGAKWKPPPTPKPRGKGRAGDDQKS
jgi:hypothetical protein